MTAELIERLARLRGIGDAYHDYRGELKYFSLESKTDLLKAMGCDTRAAAAIEAQIRAIESQKTRALLPGIAVARGGALDLEVNVTAREFGSSLIWRVILEDGAQHDGVISTTALAEIWRGELDGAWVTRRRFELPVPLPEGDHNLEAKLSGRAATLFRSCRAARWRAFVGRRAALVHLAQPPQLGHWRFRGFEAGDTLARRQRRRIHRVESLAFPRAGRAAAVEPVQRVEQELPEYPLHRR